ncbi:MAG: hypothetical protein M3340_00345 [Actinomycetota bacterium]|nr:hypothetical protein [Actinomycetota bacterium]
MDDRSYFAIRPAIIVAIVVAFLTAAVLVLVPGWNSDEAPNPRAPLGTYDGCVVVDVSSSTRKSRHAYLRAAREFALRVGTSSDGEICVITAGGNPLASEVLGADVGPDRGVADNNAQEKAQVSQKVDHFVDQLGRLLEAERTERPGSAVIASMIAASRALREGGRLLVATDGLETSSLGQFTQMNLSPPGRRRFIVRLQRRDLLARLGGVTVEMPFLNFSSATVAIERQVAIEAFWLEYLQRAGATVEIGRRG